MEYILILKAMLDTNFLPTRPVDDPQPWPKDGGDFAQYLGQATVLLRLSGHHVLIDPMFSRRFSLAKIVKRRSQVPLALDELPPIDLVLLSHAHGDHLDLPSLKAIAADNPSLTLVAAEGVASYAKRKLRNIAPHLKAHNLAWRQRLWLDGMKITAWPGKHLGGRHWVTLDFLRYKYCGFVIQTPKRTVYFPGDSGSCPHFAGLKDAFDIDLALMPIDAFNRRDFLRVRHMAPEDALDAFAQSGARRMLPVHWGTFTLCNEPLDLARQRLDRALEQRPHLDSKVKRLPLGGVLAL